MTPMPGFVKDLHAYDRQLRVRWSTHTSRWLIERKLPPRNPQFLREIPNAWTSPRGLDLYEGITEGYVHVMSVHPDLLAWSIVAPELSRCDAERAGGFAGLNAELDAAEAQWQAGVDRERQNFLESASRAAHDDLAWADGRRVVVGETLETEAGGGAA